jgi:GTP-binding protein EngB required for normal cell division
MPGYGKKSEEKWGLLVFKYLQDRPQLKRIFVLLDMTKKVNDADKAVMGLLDELKVPFQVILTKRDLLPRELLQFETIVTQRLEEYVKLETIMARPKVLVTSVKKSVVGLHELQCEVLDAAELFKV